METTAADIIKLVVTLGFVNGIIFTPLFLPRRWLPW